MGFVSWDELHITLRCVAFVTVVCWCRVTREAKKYIGAKVPVLTDDRPESALLFHRTSKKIRRNFHLILKNYSLCCSETVNNKTMM